MEIVAYACGLAEPRKKTRRWWCHGVELLFRPSLYPRPLSPHPKIPPAPPCRRSPSTRHTHKFSGNRTPPARALSGHSSASIASTSRPCIGPCFPRRKPPLRGSFAPRHAAVPEVRAPVSIRPPVFIRGAAGRPARPALRNRPSPAKEDDPRVRLPTAPSSFVCHLLLYTISCIRPNPHSLSPPPPSRLPALYPPRPEIPRPKIPPRPLPRCPLLSSHMSIFLAPRPPP